MKKTLWKREWNCHDIYNYIRDNTIEDMETKTNDKKRKIQTEKNLEKATERKLCWIRKNEKKIRLIMWNKE